MWRWVKVKDMPLSECMCRQTVEAAQQQVQDCARKNELKSPQWLEFRTDVCCSPHYESSLSFAVGLPHVILPLSLTRKEKKE